MPPWPMWMQMHSRMVEVGGGDEENEGQTTTG